MPWLPPRTTAWRCGGDKDVCIPNSCTSVAPTWEFSGSSSSSTCSKSSCDIALKVGFMYLASTYFQKPCKVFRRWRARISRMRSGRTQGSSISDRTLGMPSPCASPANLSRTGKRGPKTSVSMRTTKRTVDTMMVSTSVCSSSGPAACKMSANAIVPRIEPATATMPSSGKLNFSGCQQVADRKNSITIDSENTRASMMATT
mmetsp:Transcript_40695/g.93529  ORF Transcript_40695/g.93529 Transcript_40695/m.93529 type:complete len:202 (+) Transcript_40695:301-906(+)